MVLTEQEILNALSEVQDPELKKDIVSLGMVKDIKITGGKISFSLALTTPKCPMRQRMSDDSKAALMALSGVQSVEIKFTQLEGVEPAQACVPDSKQKMFDMKSEDRLLGVKYIVSVASGKGGVGKSTIAVNIAAALASDNHAVGLLDADIYGPSIPTLLGINEMPPIMDGKITPIEKYGMKAISMGMFIPANEALIWRGPMVMKAIQQFLDDVEWGELEYLIIDFPPGTGDAQLSIAQLINTTGAIVVTTPQDLAFLDVTRAVAMFEKINVPVIGIVENMSYFKCPHCGQETEIFQKGSNYLKAGQLGYPLLASLPMEPKLAISGDEGKPIVLSEPFSEISVRLINLARKIHGEVIKLKRNL